MSISSGYYHACTLASDGYTTCWAFNSPDNLAAKPPREQLMLPTAIEWPQDITEAAAASTNTPTPTLTPVTTSTLTPTQALEEPKDILQTQSANILIIEPSVSFHALRAGARTGDPVGVSLSVGNVDPKLRQNIIASVQAPTGLSLNGASCTSTGLCTAIFELSSGQQDTMQLEAISNQAGNYTLVADVTYSSGGSASNTLSKSLELNITDSTEVIIHANQTDVELGEYVSLTLTAANSIARPTMTLQLILRIPSGWVLSGTGFAESCAGQCIATYEVNQGEQRTIYLQLEPNQEGSVEVEALMEWYFGEDESTLEKKEESLRLNATAPTALPTPTVVPIGPIDAIIERPVSLGGAAFVWVALIVILAFLMFLRTQNVWSGLAFKVTILALVLVIGFWGALLWYGLGEAGAIGNGGIDGYQAATEFLKYYAALAIVFGMIVGMIVQAIINDYDDESD